MTLITIKTPQFPVVNAVDFDLLLSPSVTFGPRDLLTSVANTHSSVCTSHTPTVLSSEPPAPEDCHADVCAQVVF